MQPLRYVSPQERAEFRSRLRRFWYVVAIVLPLLFVIVLVGYSDQAPAWLRVFAANVDAFFGQSVLSLIRARAGA